MEDGSPVFNTLEFADDSYESKQIKKENYEKIKQFIEELPLVQREVLVMRHYMNMSFKEISEVSGVSINTALGRMRYALINLRKKININRSAYDKNIYPK